MGEYTPNDWFYKPSYGAQGQSEKDDFDAGLDAVDEELEDHKSRLDELNTRELTDIQDTDPSDGEGLLWNDDESRYEPSTVFSKVYTSDKTFNIPSDYNDWQEAFDDLSEYRTSNCTITINIESGTTIDTPLELTNKDFRNFRITSDDDEVDLDSDFPSDKNVIHVLNNCVGPRIDILINGDNAECLNGIAVEHLSSLHMEKGSGAKNISSSSSDEASGIGLLVYRACSVFGEEECVFTNCSYRGMHLSAASSVTFTKPDVSDAGENGVFVSRSSNVQLRAIIANNCQTCGVEVIRSVLSCPPMGDVDGDWHHAPQFNDNKGTGANGAAVLVGRGGTFISGIRNGVKPEIKDAADIGIRVQGAGRAFVPGAIITGAGGTGADITEASNAMLKDADLSGAGDIGIAVKNNSVVDALGADVSGAGLYGVQVQYGSTLHLQNATISTQSSPAGTSGIQSEGGTVYAKNATIDYCEDEAVRVESGGYVVVDEASITNAETRGLSVSGGSYCSATNADISDATKEAIRVTEGSYVNAQDADVSGHGSAEVAIGVMAGSIVNANGISDDSLTNVSPNSVEADGILFN